jgi:hypothetical protein
MISQDTRWMIGFRYGYLYNLFCEVTNDVDLVDELSGDSELIGTSMLRFYARIDYWRTRYHFWVDLKCIRECIHFCAGEGSKAHAVVQAFLICELDEETGLEIVYKWSYLFTVRYNRLLDILNYYRRSAIVGRLIESRK